MYKNMYGEMASLSIPLTYKKLSLKHNKTYTAHASDR